MFGMFATATAFNGNLVNWDVSSVTDMNAMFYGATAFNGNLFSWNVSLVIDMSEMFSGASAFNQISVLGQTFPPPTLHRISLQILDVT